MTENTKKDWAVDLPTKRIGRPYSLKLGLDVLKNNIFGPSKRYQALTWFIPQKMTANVIEKKLKIGFTGDLMPLLKTELRLAPGIKDFFKDIDYLVTNFEGSLFSGKTDKKVAFAQIHEPGILDKLEELVPAERIVLSLANNHTADFGYDRFLENRKVLKERGFRVIGRRDEASVKLDHNVRITACTEWSNQAFDFLSMIQDVDRHYDEKAAMNILYPHWGHELFLYPSPRHIQRAEKFLNKWDVVAGHHSHAPAPVTLYETGGGWKPVAFSLGDFCTGLGIEKYRHGMILKIDVGPGKTGQWRTGDMEWQFTYCNHENKRVTLLEAKEACPYFNSRSYSGLQMN